jgi:hypothetical protein
VVQIHKCNGYENGTEIQIDNGAHSIAITPVDDEKYDPGEEFNQGIAFTDGGFAVGTTPTQKEPTENWNIFPGFDAMVTVGAVRRR